MKKGVLIALLTVGVLSGCQDEPVVDTLDNGIMPEIVEVDITTAEAQVANEPVKLQATIKQGEELVEDASVQFEVWQSGKREEGKLVDGVHTGDGVYSAQYTFTEDGVYYMYAHTNARGLHVMPKQEIMVGNPNPQSVLEDKSTDSMAEMPHK